MKGEHRVVAVFFGDAGNEEGATSESLNFAALKQLPIIFFCENNFYSVQSPLRTRQPAREISIWKWAQGYGLESTQCVSAVGCSWRGRGHPHVYLCRGDGPLDVGAAGTAQGRSVLRALCQPLCDAGDLSDVAGSGQVPLPDVSEPHGALGEMYKWGMLGIGHFPAKELAWAIVITSIVFGAGPVYFNRSEAASVDKL
jgi:hypothetical protein